MQFSLIKATYEAKVQERIISSRTTEICDVAKCLSFCSQVCESQCGELDSTEESFLGEISWTKDMCDVERSKTLLSERCNDLKSKSSECDANCDSSMSTCKFMTSFL